MKNLKKVLALVLVLATLMGFATVAGAAEYKDADKINADYTEAIKVLDLIETMQGYPNGEFKPTATITREEAAKVIAIFDNKDSDISTYYTSINPFADEKGRWGESYVGYGYRAGIIAGMNATTFAPTSNVTGTQFLKMALVTLGYDQEAEGFVGSSWAVNVLALAKRIGLIDGLNDGWKPEADLTRQEAAQILLNTLNAETVEYAQETKTLFKSSRASLVEEKNAAGEVIGYRLNGKLYLTVAGAVKTGKALYEDFDLKKNETKRDAFMRPYVEWKKGKDTVETMKAPKATFTTKFSACDLLVALGIEESDTDTQIIINDVYVNGVDVGSELYNKTEGNATYGVWNHTTSKCDADEAIHGAQGTLTQVFEVDEKEDGTKCYEITSIDTWLAKVSSVTKKTTARDEHLREEGSVALNTVWTLNKTTYGYNKLYCTTQDANRNNGQCNDLPSTLTYDDPTGLAKNDYVLLTYSFKTNAVESADVVTGKDGRFNGYKNAAVSGDPTQTRIDGEFVKDAQHFHLGYDLSKQFNKNDFGTYTFYYDAYGNVIGMEKSKESDNWAVIDRAWTSFENKGETILNADVVDLAAKTTTSTVKKFTDINEYYIGVTDVNNNELKNLDADNFAYELAVALKNLTNGQGKDDFETVYDHLVKVTTDSEGVYSIKVAKKDNAAVVDSFGSLANNNTETEVVNGKAYLKTTANGQEVKIVLTSDTQFLVHKMDGTYESYTGYKNVPSMIAHYAEVVYTEDNDKVVADVVYLTKDVYMTDAKLTAYVGKSAYRNVQEVKEGKTYYGLTIYVDGEAQDVFVDINDRDTYFGTTFQAGFYQFQKTDIDGIETVAVLKNYTATSKNYLTTPQEVAFLGNGEIKLASGEVYTFVDKTALYVINTDNEVEVKDVAYLQMLLDREIDTSKADHVQNAHNVYMVIDDETVSAIYMIEEYND